jgi:hypothetical protein
MSENWLFTRVIPDNESRFYEIIRPYAGRGQEKNLPCERHEIFIPHTPTASATTILFLPQMAMLADSISRKIVEAQKHKTHTRNATNSEEEARAR